MPNQAVRNLTPMGPIPLRRISYLGTWTSRLAARWQCYRRGIRKSCPLSLDKLGAYYLEGEGEDRKGTFVRNFSKHPAWTESKFWVKRSVKMERMEELASEIHLGESLLSLDLLG